MVNFIYLALIFQLIQPIYRFSFINQFSCNIIYQNERKIYIIDGKEHP